MLLKWLLKKLGFQGVRDLLNSGMKKEVFEVFFSDNYKIRQKKEKSVGRISEKLEVTSK